MKLFRAFHVLTHLILKAQWDMNYYYIFSFSDEETDAQKG